MVDFPSSQAIGQNDGNSKFRILMSGGKPAVILKSKLLTVLGNSNELLNRISTKLEETLDLSSDSDYCDEDETQVPDDESIDLATIDFDARKVKARRAHEEIISGRFRYPNLVPKKAQTKLICNGEKAPSSSSSDSSVSKHIRTPSSSRSSIDTKSIADSKQIEDFKDDQNHPNGNNITCKQSVDQNVKINVELSIDNDDNLPALEKPLIKSEIPGQISPGMLQQLEHKPNKISNSSTLTSLNDPTLMTASFDSLDIKNFVHSDSMNSEFSWASSISLDDETEENNKEFMKRFIEILFTNSASLTAESKAEFGDHARTENGRLWFARYVTVQRVKSKRVDETTFYSLVQYFAIILFECNESEDYSPAKILMNMCFTFYRDIEVPGCEPYREYLYTHLRQQPIWHTLRFWNAAFFDALQCERAHRPVPIVNKKLKNKNGLLMADKKNAESHCKTDNNDHDDDDESSSSSEHNEDASIDNELVENIIFQQNITFGQLGTFTCNMHAFGLNRDLCLEFVRKQCTIANLSKEQIRLIKENINRMYLETEKWGAQTF